MSAVAELRRIADTLEKGVPAVERVTVVPPRPFSPGLLTVLLRSCPSPELIRRVPGEFFEAVDRVAVVRCPCEHVPVCQVGWSSCPGCDRTYIWSGAQLFAVKGGVPDGCRCHTVRRAGRGFVCVDCGTAA